MGDDATRDGAASDAPAVNAAKGSRACAIAWGYAFAIAYGSLLPFDFARAPLSSLLPLYLKSGGGGAPWSITDVVTNVALFVPLGFVAVTCLLVRGTRSSASLQSAAVVSMCAALAALVEFAQLYFPTRDSSLRDLVANVVGAAIGIVVALAIGRVSLASGERAFVAAASAPPPNPRLAPVILAGIVLYVIGLGAAAGFVTNLWGGFATAFARVAELVDAPFRTYVAADALRAVVSAVGWLVLYVPIGIAIRFLYLPGRPPRVAAVMAVAAAIALVLEAAKLFVIGKTADTGNIFIAAMGATVGFLFVPIVAHVARGTAVARGGATSREADLAPRNAEAAQRTPGASPSRIGTTSLGAHALAALAALAAIAFAASYPLRPAILALALVAYAGALVRWPSAWLGVLPAALPFVDFTPLTGRFFFDEFDALMVVTLGVGAWHVGSGRLRVGGLLYAFASLLPLIASVAISAAIGAWPLEPLDANAFSSYSSHYNALRVAKGFAWSFMLVPLFIAAFRDGVDVPRQFAVGTVAGLAGAVSLALWERAAYPGFLDFASDFRIGAFVASMHNGGGHIETYLLLAMPFLLPLAMTAQRPWSRAGLALLFAAATYAVTVTFSRAAYAGYAAMVILLLFAAGRHALRGGRARFALGALAVATLGLAIAAPVVTGGFSKYRFSSIDTDLRTRTQHWRDAMTMMSPDIATTLLGSGLGSYPRAYLYGNREGGRPATYRYEREGNDTFLRLGAGDPLYFEQIVDVVDRHRYRLTLRMRANNAGAELNVLLCERTYFHSYGCESATFGAGTRTGEWETREATLDSGRLGAGTWPLRRAVKLSLENTSQGIIDVDTVSLVDDGGRELVENGGFGAGGDRWYFSSNITHLSWHIKNLWLGLYFEQGVLGVLSFALVVLVAGLMSLRRMREGDPYAAAALAALVSFLCIGLFDTLVDAPRLTLMLMSTLFATRALFDPLARPWERESASSTRDADSQLRAPPGVPAVDGPPLRNAAALPLAHLGPAALRSTAIAIAAIAVAVAVVTRMPFVPYNLRDLPNPYHPLAAPVVLAVFFVWVAAAPGWAVVAWQRLRAMPWAFPLVAAAHGVGAWWVIRFGALPAMVHKVTGTPVLGWPWELETLARFAVLEGTLFTLLAFGALVVATSRRTISSRTLGVATLWLVPIVAVAYAVIIVNAATDNLVELLDPDALMAACAALAAWVAVLGYAAARLSADSATKGRNLVGAATWLLVSVVAGYALLRFGTAPTLSKYGTDFSALQFLLSTDRSHYAGTLELGLRYAVVHTVLVIALACAQRPAWRVAVAA